MTELFLVSLRFFVKLVLAVMWEFGAQQGVKVEERRYCSLVSFLFYVFLFFAYLPRENSAEASRETIKRSVSVG